MSKNPIVTIEMQNGDCLLYTSNMNFYDILRRKMVEVRI